MTKLGGWWMTSLTLPSEETLKFKYPANYFAGDRPYGGRLYLTDDRLVFLPHRIDSLFGASAVSIWYPDIEVLDIETATDRGGDSERIPDRLLVGEREGPTHLMILSDLEEALDRIQSECDRIQSQSTATLENG